MYRVSLPLVTCSVLIFACPVLAQDERSTIRSLCDQAAASPLDATRPSNVRGVEPTKIHAEIAIIACESAAKAAPGDPRIAFQLGRAYGAARRYEDAAIQYEKADGKGHLLAANNLAVLFELGRGVTKDVGRALLLFQKAADGGIAAGANNLAKNYMQGVRVPKDDEKAREWFKRAMALGDTDAMVDLAMLPPGDNKAETCQLMKQAAEGNNVRGSYYYGICLIRGEASDQNPDLAGRLIKKAADAGLPQAIAQLGVFYEFGTAEFPQNLRTAKQFYEKAIGLGNADARDWLERVNKKLEGNRLPSPAVPPPSGNVQSSPTSQAIPPQAKADNVTFVFVTFQEDASKEDLTAFLRAYNVSIVEGPNARGFYKLRLADPLPSDQLQPLLDSMKGQPRIVSSAVAVAG